MKGIGARRYRLLSNGLCVTIITGTSVKMATTTEQAVGAVSDCHFIAVAGEPHDVDFLQHVVSRMHVSRP